MKSGWILCCLILLNGWAVAQNKYVDSLQHWLDTHPEKDTQRVMTTHRLSYRLSEINTDRAWKYATETQQVAEQIKFDRGLCLANINFAILESNEGNYKSSADYYLKAIKIAEEIEYTRGLSISYNNIADNYLDLKEYESAIQYSNKALVLNKSINEKRGQAINLEQLGNIHFSKGNYDKAKSYWDQGYVLAKESGDANIYAQLLIDLAKYNLQHDKINEAELYLKEADSISTASSEILSLILTYKIYADLYFAKNDTKQALSYLHRAMHQSKILGNKGEECDIYNLLSLAYEKTKVYDSGIYYLRKHKLLSDTVLSDKNFAHLAFIQTKHESELKDKENLRLKSVEKSQQKTINEKNWLLLASLIALGLAGLSIFLIFRTAQNKKKHLELEEQNRISLYNQQIAELEVKSLRSQMNPHFLFNSLNSIRNYIIKNESQVASNYLADFATLMRKILDASQQSKIAIEEEIAMLKLYINLELMRFSNGFSYTVTMEEELENENIHIPSMMIQPFVENAIWHGLLNKETGDSVLKIHFKENHDNLNEIICEIEDNGIGRKASMAMQNSVKKHKSKGILITTERLKRLSDNANENSIEIIDLVDNQDQALGTKVILRLPIL